LGYVLTMTVYCSSMVTPIVFLVWIIKKIRFFSKKQEWTILKELLSIFIIILGIGITVYLIAFLIEESSERWNIMTFLDSCQNAFLVCVIPFTYFTLKNYRYSKSNVFNVFSKVGINDLHPNSFEELININSKLKNEELSFYPSQFLYAISDGNYVNFYLNDNNQIRKETIRNSISNIEEQLSEFPFLVRTHRAFLINIRKVIKKKGNYLGYKLDIEGIDEEIPVSRQKIQIFDKLFREYN